MRAPDESQSVQFAGWTLRIRSRLVRDSRLVLMLHGWTGDENSMWVFAHTVPADRWILAPRALHTAEPFGYSWRMPGRDQTQHAEFAGLRASADALLELIDSYCHAEHLSCGKFDVVGFSQGAALAASLAILNPARVAKVALLAGFLPHGVESALSGRPLQGMEFFIAHGSRDEMVDIENARIAATSLEDAGGAITVCEAEVGHKVSAGCLRGLQAFWLS